MNHYINVFIESVWVSSLIPMGTEPTFFAMKYFGGHNMLLAWILAVAGTSIGYSFNWWAGRMIAKLKKSKLAKPPRPWQLTGKRLFDRYGIFLLLFAWAPMLNLLLVVTGLLGTRLKTALTLSLTGAAACYGVLAFL